jgi:mannose-1-phosphate guanylyltransferase
MATNGDTWTIVLAAGDGSRLATETITHDGTVVPKQFYDFGGTTLLGSTLQRARGIVRPSRLVTVVSDAHRRWWGHGLPGLRAEHVVNQPRNRGTAAGVLLPVLHVHARDPNAILVVLPSDHHVADELALRTAIHAAREAARAQSSRVVLLGITPDSPESDYGWILASPSSIGPTRPVAAFVEKPDRARAAELLASGASWSSFMMVGHVRAFIQLFAASLPHLLRDMLMSHAGRGVRTPRPSLVSLYDGIPSHDFSRDVLEPARDRLLVTTVPPCGWSDLGTPARLAAWKLQRQPMRRRAITASATASVATASA